VAKVITDDRKVWLVPHPTSQFKENVKKIARAKNLRIVDALFRDSIDPKTVKEDPPKLTKVADKVVEVEKEKAE